MDMDQKRAYWQDVIERQATSGETIGAWCKTNGIKEAQYYAWKARLRSKPSVEEAGDAFIALDLPRSGKLSIAFGRDIRVEVDGDCSLLHLRSALEVLCGSRRCWR